MNKISLEGLFTVNGKILVAPIEGSGKFTAAVGKKMYNLIRDLGSLLPGSRVDELFSPWLAIFTAYL